MNLEDYRVALVIFWVLAIVGGNVGSISSIRAEWHAQHIYHRCIMPSVMSVCFLPTAVGVGLGYAAYHVALRILLAPVTAAVVAGGLVSLTVSIAWARRRGRRIYAGNVRRAGF